MAWSTLQVGRLGVQVQINFVQDVGHSVSMGTYPTYRFSGIIGGGLTLANSKLLRDELISMFDWHAGNIYMAVPIRWSADPNMDGFYRLLSLDIGTVKIAGAGWSTQIPFSFTAEFIGGVSMTMFQSMLSISDVDTDFDTESEPWHSPAAGAHTYSTGGEFPDVIQRMTTEGNVIVAVGLSPDVVDPTWTTTPTEFYYGAARITTDGVLRAGLHSPNTPASWLLSNGLVEVRPGVTSGASNGVIEVRWYNGTTWGSWHSYSLLWAGTNAIPEWNFITITWNTPEVCRIKLMRDAAEDTPTTALHSLDLALRRGSRYVSGAYYYDADPQLHGVRLNPGNVASTRPSSASYFYGDSLIDGNRWVIGCPKDFTLTGSTLKLDDLSQYLPFWLGNAVANAANDTFNGPADLTKQYLGWASESVQAVRR